MRDSIIKSKIDNYFSGKRSADVGGSLKIDINSPYKPKNLDIDGMNDSFGTVDMMTNGDSDSPFKKLGSNSPSMLSPSESPSNVPIK